MRPAATTIWPMRSPACWWASTSTAGSRWSGSATYSAPTAGAPPLPRHCGMVVFAAVAMEGADVAVVYAAHLPREPPLYILDAVAQPLWRDFFADTAARLQELKRACNAQAAAVFTPADLIPLFEMPGLIVQVPAGLVRRRSEPRFRRRDDEQGAGQVLRPGRRQDEDPEHRGGVGVQGGRCGRDGAPGGVHPGDLPEVRHEADEPPPGGLTASLAPIWLDRNQSLHSLWNGPPLLPALYARRRIQEEEGMRINLCPWRRPWQECL